MLETQPFAKLMMDPVVMCTSRLLKTYLNFVINTITIVNSKCGDSCPHNTAKVCASDGKTYLNDCIMKFETCQAGNLDVRKVHDGPCGRCQIYEV